MDNSKKVSGSAVTESLKRFNDFFYKSEEERPLWMHGSENSGSDEEKLLDDAHARYIYRSCSIDSTRSFSRTCSLESDFNEPEEETEVVLRVAMCCGSCENKVMSLTQMEGVSTVVCDRKTEKVTVRGTARPRDILEACKKLFEQSKIWSANDGLDDFLPKHSRSDPS